MTPEAFRAALEQQGLKLDERDEAAALETARFLAGAVERLKAAQDRGDDVAR